MDQTIHSIKEFKNYRRYRDVKENKLIAIQVGTEEGAKFFACVGKDEVSEKLKLYEVERDVFNCLVKDYQKDQKARKRNSGEYQYQMISMDNTLEEDSDEIIKDKIEYEISKTEEGSSHIPEPFKAAADNDLIEAVTSGFTEAEMKIAFGIYWGFSYKEIMEMTGDTKQSTFSHKRSKVLKKMEVNYKKYRQSIEL